MFMKLRAANKTVHFIFVTYSEEDDNNLCDIRVSKLVDFKLKRNFDIMSFIQS